MKNIYVVEYMQLFDDKFLAYHKFVFSSKAKANNDVDQSIEINKGFDINENSVFLDDKMIRCVDYSSYSNSDNKLIRIRRVIYKLFVH